MPLIYKDRIRQKITASGTGSLPLSTPIASYTTFANAGLGANSFPYAIVNDLQYEVGVGRFTDPSASSTTYGVLERDLVLSNSNGNTSLINFSGSAADAFITNASELSVLVSTQPSAGTYQLIKWTGSQYELIDPVENYQSLGASIGSSLTYFNHITTNFEASPNLKFLPGTPPELYINGVVQATAKSFLVPHPYKKDKMLQHGCLEGPEHAMYLRGSFKFNFTHELIIPLYFKMMTNNDVSVYISTDSFIPVKTYINPNTIYFQSMIPSLFKINVNYLIVASRNDIDFSMEV